MHHSQRLPRLKPLVAMLSSAYAVFGLLVSPCAQAQTTTNPVGSTLTSTVSLTSPTYANGDSYINNGTIHTGSGAGVGFSGGYSPNFHLSTIGNSGVIRSDSVLSMSAGLWIENGVVDVVNNSGTMSGLRGGLVGSGSVPTRVTAFNNSGTISSNGNDVAFRVYGATIANLTNTGTISGAGGILVGTGGGTSGTISTLNNAGLISGWSDPAIKVIYTTPGGVLSALVNSGTIAGEIRVYNADVSDPLTISNDSAHQGTLTGYGGTVGEMVAGNIIFASGSQLLNDNVTIGGSGHMMYNSGATLQVNNVVSITGNYSQAAGASLLIGVGDAAVAGGSQAGDSGYGRLLISGTATIASGSSLGLVRSGASYTFADGQRYVVARATAAGSNFNESTLHYSASGFGGTLSGSTLTSGSTASLLVSLSGGRSTVPQASTHNAVSALNGLGHYGGVSGGLLDLYNASLALPSSAEANRVGEQLAPTQSVHAGSAASGATLDVLSVVGQHADSVRQAEAGGGSGVSAGDSYADWQAWGQFFAGEASQGTIDGVSGFDAKYNGVVAGADRMFGDRWRAGAAFSYSTTRVQGAGNVSGNTSRVYSWGLVGYASYYGNPWYLNLSGSLNRQNYHTARRVTMTGYSDTAMANFNGDQYVLKGELGYPLAGWWGSTVTPLAALSYSQQHQDGYSETSANGAALKVGSSRVEALRSSLGGKIDKSWLTRYGELTPSVQLMWSHQFNKNRTSVTSSYLADPTGDTSFTTQGATPVQDTADLSLGLTLRRANNLSLTARYDRQDGAHYRAQTVSLRLRKQF